MIGQPAAQVKASARLGFQFRPTPAAVIGSGLPSTAVLLFSILIDESKRRGWRTRLTNAALAARLGRTPRTIKRLLALLESHGLVARDLVADGRIRTGIKITWDGVGHPQPMNARTEGRESPAGGKSDPLKVGHSGLPSSESPVQSSLQTVGSSIGDEQAKDEPRPSPAEAAALIRDMIAGKFAPMMFDAEPAASSSAPTGTTTSPAKGGHETPTLSAKPKPAKPATPARAAKPEPHGGLNLFRAVKGAAPAAWSESWGSPPRYTPEDLMRQLRERRQRIARAGAPSPAPLPGAGPSSAGSTQSGHLRANG